MPGSRVVWGIVAGGVLAVIAAWVLAGEEGAKGARVSAPSGPPATPSSPARTQAAMTARTQPATIPHTTRDPGISARIAQEYRGVEQRSRLGYRRWRRGRE